MHTVMSYTDWLRNQVSTLEQELRRHSVFDDAAPATPAQLEELRRKVVIHTYLRQQLVRRESTHATIEQRVDAPEFDTQEFELVR